MTFNSAIDLITQILVIAMIIALLWQNHSIIKQNKLLSGQRLYLTNQNDQLRDSYNQIVKECNALVDQNKILRSVIVERGDDDNDTR